MLLLVFVPAVIAVGMLEFNDRYYYITASLIIICSFIPFLMIFEKRRPRARELVVIAVMTALGVAGRAAFYMLPQFKPIAATVIITGVSLGCEAGFITGALTAFVSNMFFGQGPWTPWQMFALGLLGFISGLVFRKDIRTKLSVHYCAFTVHYQPFHLRRHHGFGICPYGGFGTDVGGIACSICFRAAVQPYFCRCNGGFSFGADAPDTQ